MAGFSKSVWQGQGVPQQTEPNRVPEILGNFGNNLSRGVERWIQASEEKRERQKREAQFAKGTRQALVAMGALSREEADTMGAGELMAYGNQLPQIMAKKQRDQESGLINEMLGLSTSKSEPVYGMVQQEDPEVRAGIDKFLGGVSERGMKPDGAMPTNESLWGVASAPSRMSSARTGYGRGMAEMAKRAMAAQQDIQANDRMLQQSAKDLEPSLMRDVKVQTGTKEVPMTEAEYKAQLGGLAEKYPMAAGLLQKFITGKELSVSDQLAMRKEIREDAARSVPGVGQFATVQQADKFRTTWNDANKAVQGLNRLLEIEKMGIGAMTDPTLRSEAQALASMIRGSMRLQLVGPGAVTESEQKILEGLVRDPTKIFQNPFGKEASLRTVLNKVKKATVDEANSYGLKVDESIFGGPAKAGPTVKRYNPSTGKVE